MSVQDDISEAMRDHEECLLRILDAMRAADYNGRRVSIAVTKVEEAFMAIQRAIYDPPRHKLGDGWKVCEFTDYIKERGVKG